jgi:beta-mannosidase
MGTAAPSARTHVGGNELLAISDGWHAAAAPAAASPDLESLDLLSWVPAAVPGTAASALRDAGLWRAGETHDFDAEDWWFRTSFDASPAAPGEELRLRLDGIATVAEVYLNGELVLESSSMFARHWLDVGERLRGANELIIRCRALRPLLDVPRSPRARWRTRLVYDGRLRFFRTLLLGRTPGIAPEVAAVGPWRTVALERVRLPVAERLALRPRLHGDTGVLSVSAQLRAPDGAPLTAAEVELGGPSGLHRAPLTLDTSDERTSGCVQARGELSVDDVARWWPHTHGSPVLHDVRLIVSHDGRPVSIDAGRVGFRDLAFGGSAQHSIERDGLDLHVNGVRVFARGAIWTPADLVGLSAPGSELRELLEHVRAAGMNMLRLAGTGVYENAEFHDLCDELGILVWQDMMFANLDYPLAEEHFRGLVEDELDELLDMVAGRPSLAVVCGNSEVEQQVAMLGLDPALGRDPFFAEVVPAMLERRDVDAAYVPSAPCGGDLPFRTDRGIASYYGVGSYLQPLQDTRRAEVRFAAECLAMSNVPDETMVECVAGGPAALALDGDRWRASMPRDAGTSWDFEDVRDHYLELLFGVDAAELRREDRARYLDLSRALTGEIMAEVFGEWRRAGSPCGGGLVLWLKDLMPGAGWGLLDARGTPKAALRHLARALAPVAVWTIDEGLGGVSVHVANDRRTPLTAWLRVSLYSDLERRVDETRTAVELEPHSQAEWNVESLLGRFVDVSWAYRFGAPAQDLIVTTLEHDTEHGVEQLSQAMRFPAGRPTAIESAERLGLNGETQALLDGALRLTVRSDRFAYGVRVHAPGFSADDDAFSIEPGGERSLLLRPREPTAELHEGTLSALNLDGRVPFAHREQSA